MKKKDIRHYYKNRRCQLTHAQINKLDDLLLIQFQKLAIDIPGFKLVKAEVFKFIDSCTEKFDFIFAGPPYALGNINDLPKNIFEKELLNPKGWFILEHTPRNDYRKFDHYKTERKYGTTIFSIFIR